MSNHVAKFMQIHKPAFEQASPMSEGESSLFMAVWFTFIALSITVAVLSFIHKRRKAALRLKALQAAEKVSEREVRKYTKSRQTARSK